MKLSYTAIWDKITEINMKHGKDQMEHLMYKLFKKRNYTLLDLDQSGTLLAELRKHFEIKE